MNSQNRSKVFLILMAMTMLMGMQAYAQTPKNELVINDFESRIDNTVEVPIYLDNSDEVVAAQFDITLPFAVPSNATATLSNRSDQHSVSFSEIDTKTYRVVIMSMQNRRSYQLSLPDQHQQHRAHRCRG